MQEWLADYNEGMDRLQDEWDQSEEAENVAPMGEADGG